MLDSMDFEDCLGMIEHTGETILPDAKFRKRPTSQRFEKVRGVSPLRVNYLIKFRDNSVLHMGVETVKL